MAYRPGDNSDSDAVGLLPRSRRDFGLSGSPAARQRPKIRLVRRPLAQLVGVTLAGRYRVEAPIGSGGMGSVYAAVDVHTGDEVAIKALNPTSFSSENLRRFRREASASTALEHRHICRVRHLGVERGTPFIVMERLHGETLRRRLKDVKSLPVAEAIGVTLQVLDALATAHAAGIIHRDVKPGNVFITTPRSRVPNVKLIDFGLAKPVRCAPDSGGDDDLSTITATDVIPGTPQYLSPEQLTGARDLDCRVDVWAAALTLFEMLAGRRAYESRSYVDLARDIVMIEIPRISSVRPDAPKELDAVVAKALAKRRVERFASAAEFRSALLEAWARERAVAIKRGAELRRGDAALMDVAHNHAEVDIPVDFEP